MHDWLNFDVQLSLGVSEAGVSVEVGAEDLLALPEVFNLLEYLFFLLLLFRRILGDKAIDADLAVLTHALFLQDTFQALLVLRGRRFPHNFRLSLHFCRNNPRVITQNSFLSGVVSVVICLSVVAAGLLTFIDVVGFGDYD